jgi:hypothetical protein
MVLQSTVHTVGGVITARDAIMMIVPQADDLSVEAKVNPQDIDKLQIGQKTLLRLSAYNQRTTPELNGLVTQGLARRHHRPAHRAILLHHPRFDAAGRSRPARRQQADPGHAGRGLRADRRPHHAVLSDQAAPMRDSISEYVPSSVFPPRRQRPKARLTKKSPAQGRA